MKDETEIALKKLILVLKVYYEMVKRFGGDCKREEELINICLDELKKDNPNYYFALDKFKEYVELLKSEQHGPDIFNQIIH